LSDVESLLRRPELDLGRIRELLRMFERALDRSDLLAEFERLTHIAHRT